MKKVIIYTDGACRGNPGPGGWGALLRYGQHEKCISGAETLKTNNRMELSAAIHALKSLKSPCKIELHTDSKYVQQGITTWLPKWKKNNWKKSDNKVVKNADLWKCLEEETHRHDIVWHWVKGHSGHVENDLVDKLANQAIDAMIKKARK